MSDGLIADKPRDECGVFGIYGPGLDVARLSYYGLFALQHRGQESAGIAVADHGQIILHKNMGLVTEVFSERVLCDLTGQMAIGHVRYSTSGASSLVNAQPLVFNYLRGSLALAHNGNLTNAKELKANLAATGSVFQTTSDSEVIVNLVARYGQNTIEEALMKCIIDIKGAYSLVVMTETQLIGVRDPYGVRPLCLGRLGEAWILASESCALTTVGAQFVRDIRPGEIVIIDENGPKSVLTIPAAHRAFCIFEHVYLARPDSVLDGETVNISRRQFGRQLAREYPAEADMVIAVPDSGTTAAIGYAEESGLPFKEGLIKNRYAGRTFIQPSQDLRDLGVRLKLSPVGELIANRRLVLVDDSIVRGTTSRRIVQMLKEAGAKEVHLMVSSPPILYPCHYGIDTSARQQLIAARLSLEEIRASIGADSLNYLSLEGMLGAMQAPAEEFCVACFNGCYPIAVPAQETSA